MTASKCVLVNIVFCFCFCRVQATCKHIAALLFAVVEAVEEGRNRSSTSQQQAWGKQPKTGVSIHEPQFARNIKIIGVHADVSQQYAENRRAYRSDFDPRIHCNRTVKPVSERNLDVLSSITNGNCGLLMYTKPKPNPLYEQPDINQVINIEEVATSNPVLTVNQAFQKNEDTTETILENLAVNRHQQKLLAEKTAAQAGSPLWTAHRKGRITASVAGDCVGSVKDTCNAVSGYSNIARVMGYYGTPQSAALNWGKEQEPIARKQYIAHHRLTSKHTNVTCTETGLWVNLECPFIAASPDGIVKCKQCGSGLAEFKNPYTSRHLSIKELAVDKGSCLEIVNNVIQLKRMHNYYAQVQVQLWSTGFTWCDFVVRTVSNTNNIFVERITLDDEYVDFIRPKLKCFFFNGILPEMKTGSVQDIVISNAVKKTMTTMLNKLDTIQTVPTVSDIYPCGVCAEECEEEPDEGGFSIGCDNCSRWFHYKCVGITGSEKFLKKRKSSWKCNGCSVRTKTSKKRPLEE